MNGKKTVTHDKEVDPLGISRNRDFQKVTGCRLFLLGSPFDRISLMKKKPGPKPRFVMDLTDDPGAKN